MYSIHKNLGQYLADRKCLRKGNLYFGSGSLFYIADALHDSNFYLQITFYVIDNMLSLFFLQLAHVMLYWFL